MPNLGQVPRPIWYVTALYFAVLLGYSVLLPIYRAPDEPQHVDLAHLFAEEGRYPAWDDRDLGTDVSRSQDLAELDSIRAGHLTADEAPSRHRRPSFEELAKPGRETSINHIPQHPPLYYVVAGGVEWIVEGVTGDPAFDVEVWRYRFLSILLVTPLPLIIWWITRQLGLTEPVAIAATLVPLAVPQFLHIGSSVNSDNLVLLTTWLATALVVRLARGDLTTRTAVVTGTIGGVGLLTKGFALVVPVFVLAALVVAARRGGAATRRPAVRAGALYLVTALLVGGWWWVRNLVVYRELSPTRFYDVVPIRDGVEVDLAGFVSRWAQRTTTGFWGRFGWLTVDMPAVLVVLATAVVVVGLVVGCSRRDRVSDAPRGDRVLLAAPLLLLVVTQFVFALWNHARTDTFPAMQGRYWFGALAGLAVVAAVGWANLLRAHLRWLPVGVLAAAALMNGAAVAAVAGFYWGEPGDGFLDRIDALLAWAPLTTPVLVVGLLLGIGVTLATADQLRRLALEPAGATLAVVPGTVTPASSGVSDTGAEPAGPTVSPVGDVRRETDPADPAPLGAVQEQT